MRAAVLEVLNRPLAVRELPDPALQPAGAVVRVEACGICRSDWHLWKGDWTWTGVRLSLPAVLGHEFAGVVEAVGPAVARFRPGDRVVTPFHHADGTCPRCQAGEHNHCQNPSFPGSSYHGGYGRLTHVPHADVNLIPLPQTLPFEAAAAIGCRFMTAFHGLVDRAGVQAGEWVAVYGCGGVGLSAVAIATAAGARVAAVDIDDRKLARARDLGATVTVNGATTDPVAAVAEATGGGAHVSVDALGEAVTLRNAVLSLRARGRHVQIGMTTQREQGEVALPIDLMVLREVSFLGSVGMPQPRYDALLSLIASGRVDPARLIGRTVPVEEAGAVLQSMDRYDTLGLVVINRW